MGTDSRVAGRSFPPRARQQIYPEGTTENSPVFQHWRQSPPIKPPSRVETTKHPLLTAHRGRHIIPLPPQTPPISSPPPADARPACTKISLPHASIAHGIGAPSKPSFSKAGIGPPSSI